MEFIETASLPEPASSLEVYLLAVIQRLDYMIVRAEDQASEEPSDIEVVMTSDGPCNVRTGQLLDQPTPTPNTER